MTSSPSLPLHVAIIMDGSGRWALARGLPRTAGHRAGLEAVRPVVVAAPGLGISSLTLHAFSSDNWQRPAEEVANLMRIFDDYLRAEPPAWLERGVRLSVIGRRDRLPAELCNSVEAAERTTARGTRLHLVLAIDYSARDAIARTARRWAASGEATREAFLRQMHQVTHGDPRIPDLDLLIRTGGEQRLSDFFLWECAYAELVFTPRLWPDFGAHDLEAAVQEFRSRDRRFGGLPHAVAV